MVLSGMDKSTSHSVAVVDNWLFDSTLSKAQAVLHRILDWCISSGHMKNVFEEIFWGIALFPKLQKLPLLQVNGCIHKSVLHILKILGFDSYVDRESKINRDDQQLWIKGGLDKQIRKLYQYMKVGKNEYKENLLPSHDIRIIYFGNRRVMILWGAWDFGREKQHPNFMDPETVNVNDITTMCKLGIRKDCKDAVWKDYNKKLVEIRKQNEGLLLGLSSLPEKIYKS